MFRPRFKLETKINKSQHHYHVSRLAECYNSHSPDNYQFNGTGVGKLFLRSARAVEQRIKRWPCRCYIQQLAAKTLKYYCGPVCQFLIKHTIKNYSRNLRKNIKKLDAQFIFSIFRQTPLHISGVSIAHHQEVSRMDTTIGNLPGYTVPQWYQMLYCPNNALKNIKSLNC